MARLLRPIRGLRWTAGHEFGYGGFVNWVATLRAIAPAEVWRDRCKGRHSPFSGRPSPYAAQPALQFRRRHQPPHCSTPDPACAQSTGRCRVALRRPLMRWKYCGGLLFCGISRPRHLEAAVGQSWVKVSGTFSFPPCARAIELPSHFDGIALENLICDCWAKVEWGYGRILIRDGANAGWINYMLKDRQKSEFDGFVDWIIIESLHNRVLQRQQERRKDTSRKATWKMRAGPSGSAIRSRSQTTPGCCGQEPWWWALEEKFKVNLEQVSVRETNESEPTEHASLKIHNVVETRGGLCLWDESVRCL